MSVRQITLGTRLAVDGERSLSRHAWWQPSCAALVGAPGLAQYSSVDGKRGSHTWLAKSWHRVDTCLAKSLAAHRVSRPNLLGKVLGSASALPLWHLAEYHIQNNGRLVDKAFGSIRCCKAFGSIRCVHPSRAWQGLRQHPLCASLGRQGLRQPPLCTPFSCVTSQV